MNIELIKQQLLGKELEMMPHKIWKKIRVVKENGVELMGTMEFNPDRINVETISGIVTEVISIG